MPRQPFCVSFVGYPQPSIVWSKNGQELKTKDGMLISYSHNHVRLELKNVNVKDAGRYTCTASNEVGSASSTADVVVKSKARSRLYVKNAILANSTCRAQYSESSNVKLFFDELQKRYSHLCSVEDFRPKS